MKFLATNFFILICSGLFSQNDTFRVDNVELTTRTPQGWILQEVNDSMCWDSTWNYIAKYQVDKAELNARIAIQIVFNRASEFNSKEQRKAQKEFVVKQVKLEKWDAYCFERKPSKVKNCKQCGLEYLDIYAVPLSDFKTMNILFLANGRDSSVTVLKKEYEQFVIEFVRINDRAMSNFLLLNQATFTRLNDTVKTLYGTMHYYYFSNFTKEYTYAGSLLQPGLYDFVIQQTDYFYSPLKVFCTVSEYSSSSEETFWSFGAQSPMFGGNSGIANNYLNITCKRSLKLLSGEQYEFTFNARVKIQDSIMIYYYKHALENYADQIIALNRVAFAPSEKSKPRNPSFPQNTDKNNLFRKPDDQGDFVRPK